jgi:AAA+ superfamily predicted ATPase
VEDDIIMHNDISNSVRFIEEVEFNLPGEGQFKYDFKSDLKPIELDIDHNVKL